MHAGVFIATYVDDFKGLLDRGMHKLRQQPKEPAVKVNAPSAIK